LLAIWVITLMLKLKIVTFICHFQDYLPFEVK